MSTFGSSKKAMTKTMKTFNKAYKQVDPRDTVRTAMPSGSLMARNKPSSAKQIKNNPTGKIIAMIQQIRSTS